MTRQTLYRRKTQLHLVWLVAIGLLIAACADSETPATVEPSPQLDEAASASALVPTLNELPPSKYLRFDRITTSDGLSGDQAYHIEQDIHGFMWFGTANGLSRYDGSSMRVYLHDPNDPSSLSHNAIRAMTLDESGSPWLGTWGGGLNQYLPEKDAFKRYQHDPDDPHSLSSDLIRSVYQDGSGTIWVGTAAGLNKLDYDSGQFTHYKHDPDDPASLSHNLVWSILEDNLGVLWVGTENGFNRFDPVTEQFVRFQNDPDDPTSLSHNTVREIFEDRSGVLWLSTPGGLNKFDRDENQFTRYVHDASDPQSLNNNTITGVFEDSAGRLWVSTWGGGLNFFDRATETFTHFKNDPADLYSIGADVLFEVFEDQQGMFWIASDGGISIFDGAGKHFRHYRTILSLPNTLSHNVVRALHAGPSGYVWAGTSGGGLNRLDRQSEEFTIYRHSPDDPNSLPNDTVRAIYEDQTGQVWIGTSASGLSRLDPETGRFYHYLHDEVDPHTVSRGSIMGISEDQNGRLWISTWGGGLNAFDRETEQFTRYQHDPADTNSLSNNQAIVTLEDHDGVLWSGTFGGLNKFDPETETFTRYHHDPTDPSSLGHDSVTSMHEDQIGILWIGTLGGLDRFDRESAQFSHYTTVNGLPSDVIWGILEDEQGRLWLSTPGGLSHFDPQSESLRNYDVSDGLQSNTFLNFSSYSKNPDGQMFFGGSNGFNGFYPVRVVDDLQPPAVLITDFRLANKPVPIAKDSVLQQAILDTDSIELSYLDRVFSFEFAALNYRASEKNKYRFKMEGFEEEWNEVDSTRRFATYTNLDPGDYVFRVIASNNDGVWNEEGTSIKITITPPWWETTWFRIGLGVLVIGLLAAGYGWRVRSLQARSRELEAQIQLLFENSPLGIALTNLGGEFISVNKALLDMLRISDEEVSGQGVRDFYVESADREILLAELQQTGSVQNFGIQLKRTDGERFNASVNMSQLLLEGEQVLLTVVEDVTDEITAEQQAAIFEERERLARDLHDSVTQTLFSASVLAQAVPRMLNKKPAAARQNIDQLGLLIRGALAEMRTLLIELRPTEFTERSLSQLFELLAESTRARTRAAVTLDVAFSCRPPEGVAIAYYRIAQEALNNVAKHALASEVDISLICDDEGARLSVKDDGRGFDPSAIPVGHMGVSIMRERAKKIGAKINIDSKAGSGTSVNVFWSAVGKDSVLGEESEYA